MILCGGLGTRLSEETVVKPKPMVEIGGMPILWHIMKHYYHYGHNEFLLALGYKGDYIKKYFMDYKTIKSDIEIDLKSNKNTLKSSSAEDWKILLKETGSQSMTGGRLLRLKDALIEFYQKPQTLTKMGMFARKSIENRTWAWTAMHYEKMFNLVTKSYVED